MGATATYTLTGTVSASATGSLSNTASVVAPGGVTDSNRPNTSATDTERWAAGAHRDRHPRRPRRPPDGCDSDLHVDGDCLSVGDGEPLQHGLGDGARR